MCKAYEETINEYLTKGYITQEDTTEVGTFLAHFPVVKTIVADWDSMVHVHGVELFKLLTKHLIFS